MKERSSYVKKDKGDTDKRFVDFREYVDEVTALRAEREKKT